MSQSGQSAVFSGIVSRPDHVDVDVLFIPVFQDDGLAEAIAELHGLDDATSGEVGRARASGEFGGRPYDLFITPITGAWKARRVALVGAGLRSEWDAERAKRVASSAGYVARHRSAQSVGWLVRHGAHSLRDATLAADGLSLAEFETTAYQRPGGRPSVYPSHVVVALTEGAVGEVQAAVARGRIIGQAVNFARAQSNEPGNILTPREFASRIATAAEHVGLGVEVLDEVRIRELKMGLLMGVAQGSNEPARLVVLRHDPPGAAATPVLALVGKGITFDTGGISIKPAEGMERMKSDMSGGAAVAAAMIAIARLRVPHRVIGVIPTTENMPGGSAIRPGDVLTGAGGTTVEVINTDAEGRLILGDGLWYAQQLGATHLVDVATLTGACMVALGRSVSGLFGSDPRWIEMVSEAGVRGGDRVWPMPIYEEAKDQLRSEIADVINSAGRYGGASTAAAFLREFAGDLPWAHLDIAGTAWAEEKKAYQPKGPTGVAVRLLIELASSGAAGSAV